MLVCTRTGHTTGLAVLGKDLVDRSPSSRTQAYLALYSLQCFPGTCATAFARDICSLTQDNVRHGNASRTRSR